MFKAIVEDFMKSWNSYKQDKVELNVLQLFFIFISLSVMIGFVDALIMLLISLVVIAILE
jgi:hypothetical protein